MKEFAKFGILVLFALFLACPSFAQEGLGDVEVPDEDLTLTEDASEGVVTGEVTSLDVTSGKISIKLSDGREETFSVVGEETILWKGIEDIELADINEGDEAEIGYYTNEEGNFIASWVDVLVEEEIAPIEELELEPEVTEAE